MNMKSHDTKLNMLTQHRAANSILQEHMMKYLQFTGRRAAADDIRYRAGNSFNSTQSTAHKEGHLKASCKDHIITSYPIKTHGSKGSQEGGSRESEGAGSMGS